MNDRRYAGGYRIAWFAGLLVAVLLGGSGCTPSVQSIGSVPAEPRLAQDAYFARDGARLPVAIWRADGEPHAIIVAVHGFNDYRNAFSEPGPYWAASGLTVYAFDQRGFGAAPEPGIWGGVDNMTADLRDFVDLVRRRHPGKPAFLVGMSMGGAMVLATMARTDAPQVDGLVLAAPAVWGRDSMSPWVRGILWLSAHLTPWNLATGQGLNIWPSDNIEMLRRLGRDPLVIKRTRFDAIYGLVNLMDAAQAAAAKVKTPMLVLYGEKDELIPRDPVEEMVGKLAAPHRIAVYPEGWHMLFRDLQAETVWRDIVHWVGDRDAPLPSAAERRDRPLFANKNR